ncbi:MAG: DUF21 domain-containing protein [bacterium]|nr:DUF21 domain-containing protein [bacterium]
MIQLILVVIGLLIVSFTCSVLESVILSISRGYIQSLIDNKNRSGKLLFKLKGRIEEPISAILTLNTISHTVGAAVSGALAMKIFGSEKMAIFSAVLTLLILILSEIIPKTLGAQYWKELGPISAYTLRIMIFVLKPLIVPVNFIARLISRGAHQSGMSKGDIFNYIRLGYSQGIIRSSEYKIMENLFALQSVKVKDIMTPRTVVYWLAPELTIGDITKKDIQLDFTRIPIYKTHDNTIEGIVLRRVITDQVYRKKKSATLKSLAQSPEFIIDSMSVYRLLNYLIVKQIHMAIVLNEYGDYVGIVTMEDAIESLLGQEIIDEYDTVEDMRELARKRSSKKHKEKAK